MEFLKYTHTGKNIVFELKARHKKTPNQTKTV
jgi:hypothetical protein